MPIVRGVVVLGSGWLHSRTRGIVIAELLSRYYPRYAPVPPAGPPINVRAVTAAEEMTIDVTWQNGAARPTGTELWVSTDGASFAYLDTVGFDQTKYKHNTGAFGVTRYYLLRHANATAVSDFAPRVSAKSQVDLPGSPPSNLTAAPQARPGGETKIDLDWTNGDSTASTTIYGRQGTTTAFAPVVTVGPGVSAYTHTGRLPSTSYQYYAVHLKTGTESAATPTVTATTLVDGPDAPPVLDTVTQGAGIPGQGKVDLAWTNGDVTAATEVYVSVDSGATWNFVTTIQAGVASYSHPTGTFATRRDYRIRHLKNGVASAYSAVKFALSGQDIPDAPPTNLGVAAPSTRPAGETTLNVTWTNGDVTAQTRVYGRVTDGGSFSLVTTAAAGATSFSHTGRAPGTQYTYYVAHVKNGVESAPSAQVTAATLVDGPNAPPTNLVAGNPGGGQVPLTWTTGDGTSPTEIYRGTVLINTVAAGVAAYTDAPGGGQSVSYKVRHLKNGVASVYSNTASVLTLAAPDVPVFMSLTPGLDRFTLGWTNADATAQTDVYRSGGGAFSLITTVGAGVTSWVDLGFGPGGTGPIPFAQNTQATYFLRHRKNGFSSDASATRTAWTFNVPEGSPHTLGYDGGLNWEAAWLTVTAADAQAQTDYYFRRGATGAFTFIGTVGPRAVGTRVALLASGLLPTTTYSWYAEHSLVDNNGLRHVTGSVVGSFTTQQLPPPRNVGLEYRGADGNANGGDFFTAWANDVLGAQLEWNMNNVGDTVTWGFGLFPVDAGNGYLDANVPPSTTYRLIMRYRKTINGVTYFGPWSEHWRSDTPPNNIGRGGPIQNISFTLSNGSALFKWDEAGNCQAGTGCDNNFYRAEIIRPDGSLYHTWFAPADGSGAWAYSFPPSSVTGVWTARVRWEVNGYIGPWESRTLDVGVDGPPSGIGHTNLSTCVGSREANWASRINWVSGDATAQTEVYRNGVLVGTASTGATTFVHSGVFNPTTTTWKVRHKKDVYYSAFSPTLTAGNVDPC